MGWVEGWVEGWGCKRITYHSDLDLIASLEGETSEVIGVVGVPLIPGVVRDGSGSSDREVNTRLQDSSTASITIDAHPGRAGAGLSRLLGRGNSDSADYRGEAGAAQHRASPVARVLDVLVRPVHLGGHAVVLGGKPEA